MDDKKKLNSKEIKDVNGGSIWVQEDRAKAIGITLRNEDGMPGEWGYLWNTGDYYLGDRKVSQYEVSRLLDYYEITGKVPQSVEEAFDYLHEVLQN